jgi:hypothetical protein
MNSLSLIKLSEYEVVNKRVCTDRENGGVGCVIAVVLEAIETEWRRRVSHV